MLRVIKPEGFGNIQIEDVPIPTIGEGQVLVKTKRTLISRGSELFRRYNREEAIDPGIMGYALTGVVEQVGAAVSEYNIGDRVMVVAPHAESAVGDVATSEARRMVVPLPDGVSFEEGTFLPFATSGLAWAESSGAGEGDTVVILGQGQIGSVMLQILKTYPLKSLIAVDALSLRCRLAEEFGADVVVNASENDPVERVLELTGGQGADVVIDCVGGNAGVESFDQAQRMVRRGGTLHLIALYQNAPLRLESSLIMNKRLLAGILIDEPREVTARRAVGLIADGTIRAKEMITHRFPFREAKEAFDFLWHHPDEALGVILTWD